MRAIDLVLWLACPLLLVHFVCPPLTWRAGLGLYLCVVAVLFVFLYRTWRHSERRIDRRREGCCMHCGYDLRGQHEPRCPECGTAFPPRPWP